MQPLIYKDDKLHFSKPRSYDFQTWNNRKKYLIKIQRQGHGWDGFDAKAPKDASVEKALSVMKHLMKFVERPPKLMIDEDGDVTLTWGKEKNGVMVFLTIDPETLYLHVMDGCITVYPMKEFPSTSGNDKRVPRGVVKNIKRYLQYIIGDE